MGDSNVALLGCVLNPKSLSPCLVYLMDVGTTNSQKIVIYDSEGYYAGKGYYDTDYDENSEYKWSEKTGYPRAHTPDGVATQGIGLGTVLYTGLCLGAHLHYVDELRFLKVGVDGDGISSNENRSYAASAWWSQAKKHRIAYDETVEFEVEDEVEEEYDVRVDPARHTALRREVIDVLSDEGISPNTINEIELSGTEIREDTVEQSGEADIYPFSPVPSLRVLGAEPVVLFATSVPMFSPQRLPVIHPVPRQVDSKHFLEFNPRLAPLLNLSNTEPHMQQFIRQVYDQAGERKLFDALLKEALGTPYGYLLKNSSERRELYDELRIADFASLPG